MLDNHFILGPAQLNDTFTLACVAVKWGARTVMAGELSFV